MNTGNHSHHHNIHYRDLHRNSNCQSSQVEDPTSDKVAPWSGMLMNYPEAKMSAPKQMRGPVKYETTTDGDVVVVEPSFDQDEDPRSISKGEDQGKPNRGHSRNLSAHFQDATRLSTDPLKEGREMPGPPPTISPAIGQKHRRVFSGDVSNPVFAHRRINSIGNSAEVKRHSYAGAERQHKRVDSAGLDILTAAADASREELAAAAGERARGRNTWEQPGPARSPVEMYSYDHGSGAMNAPPPRTNHGAYPPPPGYMSSSMNPNMGPPQSYPPYPPTNFYSQPPPGYPRGVPVFSGYPVQYSRGQDPYMKQELPNDGYRRRSSPPGPTSDERGSSDPKDNKAMTPPPPIPPSQWTRQGTTQGVQTFVTSIGVGDGGRMIHPSTSQRHAGTNTDPNEARNSMPSSAGANHHRKMSSFSSLGPMSSIFHGQPGEAEPMKGHHRQTSSSVSFLQGFDVGLEASDAAFLQNLQASSSTLPAHDERGGSPNGGSSPTSDSSDTNNKLAPGGTSKRVRRKCTVANCENRVVQGGLCISHGAKRKTCKHAGCDKNVKKAGLCSSHGPARKRCDEGGCGKVAVQGGRCIAHGAKKKLCSMDSCSKQAILSGMCKKHHDQSSGKSVSEPPGSDPSQCNVIEGGNSSRASPPTTATSEPSRGAHKPTHTRGLSIFQDLSADAVGDFLQGDVAGIVPPEGGGPPAGRGPQHRHRTTFSRDFGGMY
jgi:hypothetical protein